MCGLVLTVEPVVEDLQPPDSTKSPAGASQAYFQGKSQTTTCRSRIPAEKLFRSPCSDSGGCVGPQQVFRRHHVLRGHRSTCPRFIVISWASILNRCVQYL